MSQQTVNRRISIFIDAAQGEASLKRLEAQQTKLATATAKLKSGSQEWIDSMARLKGVQDQVVQLQGQLSGRLGPTLSQLTTEQRMLNRELNKMPVELRAASNEAARLRQVEAAIRGVKTEAQATGGFFAQWKGQIAAGAAGVLGGNLMTSAISGVSSYVTGSVSAAAKIADQLADVRKTTGMTADEVDRLNSALGMIDTRTSTSELREMAKVAGQFGIAKDQVAGFVESVDKVNVALGDEFGGNAEAIASEMSKLRNVFYDIKSDNVGTDISHIANALNELGAAGVATGPVVADFANRIGGVGIPMGLTSGEVLGLSATLQELNITAERGGTAVGKILKKMLTNTNEFAQVAGMDVKQFSDLLNKDLYGAFTKVMEGAGKFSGKSTVLAKLIEQLEVNGAGASEVFAKLGNNTQLLQQRVDLANNSLSETASINDEVAIKANNLAGELDKLNKEWVKFSAGPGNAIGTAFLASINGLVEGAKAMFYGPGLKSAMDTAEEMADEALKNHKAREEEKANARTKYMMQIRKLSVEELEKELVIQKTIRSGWRVTMDAAIRNGDINKINETKSAYESLSEKVQDINNLIKEKKNGLLGEITEKDEKAAKQAETAAKKMADDYKKLQQEIEDLQEKVLQDGMEKHERELRAVEVKYEKLMKRAVGHATEMKQLNELLYQEQMHILDEWIAENSKKLDKEAKDFLDKEKKKTEELKKAHKERMDAEINKMAVQAELDLLRATTEDQRLQAEKDKLLAQTTKLLENDKLTADERKLIWEKYAAEIDALETNTQQKRITELQEYSDVLVSTMNTIVQFQQSVINSQLEQLRAQHNQIITIENDGHRKRLAAIDRNDKQKRERLKTDLEKGLITQKEYNAAIAQSEDDKNNYIQNEQIRFQSEKNKLDYLQQEKERELKRKSLMMQKIAAVTEAGILLAIEAFKAALFPNPFSILKVAAATVKFGVLAAMPIPQFAMGGTTVKAKGQQSGNIYNTTYVGSVARGGVAGSPQLGIIGEQGPELIIPNWLYTHPRMVDTMAAMEGMISARQFAGGGNSIRNSPSNLLKNKAYDDDNIELFNSVVNRIIELKNINVSLMVATTSLSHKIELLAEKPITAHVSYDEIKSANDFNEWSKEKAGVKNNKFNVNLFGINMFGI